MRRRLVLAGSNVVLFLFANWASIGLMSGLGWNRSNGRIWCPHAVRSAICRAARATAWLPRTGVLGRRLLRTRDSLDRDVVAPPPGGTVACVPASLVGYREERRKATSYKFS
jgi:hypothetical protein